MAHQFADVTTAFDTSTSAAAVAAIFIYFLKSVIKNFALLASASAITI